MAVCVCVCALYCAVRVRQICASRQQAKKKLKKRFRIRILEHLLWLSIAGSVPARCFLLFPSLPILFLLSSPSPCSVNFAHMAKKAIWSARIDQLTQRFSLLACTVSQYIWSVPRVSVCVCVCYTHLDLISIFNPRARSATRTAALYRPNYCLGALWGSYSPQCIRLIQFIHAAKRALTFSFFTTHIDTLTHTHS